MIVMFGWEQSDFVVAAVILLGALIAIAAVLFIIKTLLPPAHRHDAKIAELERLVEELSD